MNKASETFFESLKHDASVCRDCQCGRTYFASLDEGCFEPGELESLRTKAAEQPDRFIELDSSYVTVALIDGKTFVYDCTCDGLRRYELFILNHRHEIMAFLKAHHAEQLNVLKAFNQKLKEAYDAVKEVEKVHVPE